MLCKDNEHPLNAFFAIDITEEGIFIFFRDFQLQKAKSPIELTEGGIFIC